jgi:hypothetical protein
MPSGTGDKFMVLSSSSHEWLAVLMAADRAAQTMNSDIDEQFAFLDEFESEAAGSHEISATNARFDRHCQNMNARMIDLRSVVETADVELVALETDFRSWCTAVGSLRDRLHALISD